MEQAPRQFDPDKETKDVIDDLQRRMAQATGEVPRFPFVTGPDGKLHELVEEYVCPVDEDRIKEIEDSVRGDSKQGEKNE